MKLSMHALIWVLFSAIHATWLNNIAILGVKPNLMLVYVVVICFFCERTEGCIIGVLFGLTADIMSGRLFGTNAVLYLIAAFMTVLFCDNVIRGGNALIVVIAVAVMTFIYDTVYYMFAFSLIGQLSYLNALGDIIWIECLYNAACAVVLYFALKRLTRNMYSENEL